MKISEPSPPVLQIGWQVPQSLGTVCAPALWAYQAKSRMILSTYLSSILHSDQPKETPLFWLFHSTHGVVVGCVDVLCQLVNCAVLALLCEALGWEVEYLGEGVVLMMELCGQGDSEI